ncbi:MAG TPA: YbaY family lipoprotein [Chiayiivirga sp.]|nr:YbaY family lipoprotein [Chiayiivirga sp.]
MKFNVLVLSVSAALMMAACGGQDAVPAKTEATHVSSEAQANAQPAGPAVTGTATIDKLTTLPRGLSLVIKLVDTTDPASVPVVVAQSTQTASQILPLNLAQAYDPAKIDPSHQYGLQVALQAETLVLYGTDHPVPVLTNGAPNKGLQINLVRGGQPAVNVPPGELAKKEFADLEAHIGAMRRLHGERLEEQIAVGWDAFVEDSGQIRMAREQVDYVDAGSAQFRYAYKGGKPWVVARVQGGKTVMVGWNETGDLVLDEPTDSGVDPAALYARAQSLYTLASAQR